MTLHATGRIVTAIETGERHGNSNGVATGAGLRLGGEAPHKRAGGSDVSQVKPVNPGRSRGAALHGPGNSSGATMPMRVPHMGARRSLA